MFDIEALQEERDFLRHDGVVWHNKHQAWVCFDLEREQHDDVPLAEAIKKFAADNPHLVKPAPVDEPDE